MALTPLATRLSLTAAAAATALALTAGTVAAQTADIAHAGPEMVDHDRRGARMVVVSDPGTAPSEIAETDRRGARATPSEAEAEVVYLQGSTGNETRRARLAAR